MNQSEQINELAAALSKMQGTVGPVFKNKTAKVQMKSGGTYTYTYADLAGIWETIRKPLSDAGLSICQTFVGRELITILMHSSGQWIKSILPLSCMGLKPQELGSEITYFKRYALSSILGIAADEDEDGAIAQDAAPSYPKTNGSAGSAPAVDKSTPSISIAQAKELQALLDECDPSYQTNFWKFLKSEVQGIQKIDQLPAAMYLRIKSGIVKKREEYVKELSGTMGEPVYA